MAIAYDDLNDQVVLVTGASRGIGRVIATSFADQGAIVVVNSRTPQGVQDTVSEILQRGGRAEAAVGDVGDTVQARDLVDQTVTRHGRIDVLVSNAAINPVGPLLETTWEVWNEVQKVNVGALFSCGSAAACHMIAQGAGCVIAIGSPAASQAHANQIPYCASKAALHMLAKGMAWEWGPRGLRVNVVQPGWIETSLNESYLSDPDVRLRVARQIPARRIGRAEEVARVALWLATNDASYVNGATIEVDGGLTIGQTAIVPRRFENLQQ